MHAQQRRGVSNFDGQRLHLARTEKGWSKRQLAEAAGVSVTVLDQYEQGERAPERRTLERLAGSLDRSAGDFRKPRGTTLRDLRELAGASQQAAASAAGMTRSSYAMLEQGRTKSMAPQAAQCLAALFTVDADAIVAAHAEAVAVRAGEPVALRLEGQLLDRLSEHFGMTPAELLELAHRLAAGKGGDRR